MTTIITWTVSNPLWMLCAAAGCFMLLWFAHSRYCAIVDNIEDRRGDRVGAIISAWWLCRGGAFLALLLTMALFIIGLVLTEIR